MITFDGLDENFNFLLTESKRQVERTCQYLETFEPSLFDKIVSKDDYIDNLKTIIENNCFSSLNRLEKDNLEEINRVRATHIVCINLERIADFSVNLAKQVQFLINRKIWESYDYSAMCKIIIESMARIPCHLRESDIGQALAICKSEHEIDRLYKLHFDRVLEEMRQGENIETYITIIFIFRYIERIGDSLLNIGEAILFTIIGEKIKIKQFDALRHSLATTGINLLSKETDFKSFWGTRSGCNISKVAIKNPGPTSSYAREVIFKAGNSSKIIREKENMDRWNEILPGLVPRVITFEDKGESASLLIEFLQGSTLDEIILNADMEIVRDAIKAIEDNLLSIWKSTMVPVETKTDFMNQILTRLDSVRRIHPGYFRAEKRIDSLKIYSTEDLIKKCQEVESLVPAPFKVFIHGDFNINNILVDKQSFTIHFIDLYRSRMSDYVQDISVGLISNFRMPVFDPHLRERLNIVTRLLYNFASEFAKFTDDTTFEARLSLALARSFITSTRFEFNPRFSKNMFMRANFLMEKIIHYHENKGDWAGFRLPEAVLYY